MCLLSFLKWGSIGYPLWIVQWNFTRRDHPGNPGRVSGSGPVIPSSSGVSPSCSPLSRSLPPPAMKTSLWEPLVVKPTRGELQTRVELLVKKNRSVKRKAQDPPKSSLSARGKAPKLGVSVPKSPIKERVSHAQVRVRGQALPSLAEVFKEVDAQCRSSSASGAKGSSRRAAGPPLKVLPISVWSPQARNAMPSPPMRGMIALELRGVRTRCLPMRSSPPGLFRLSFRTLISRRWKPCALRRLWPYHSKGPSLYVQVPSFIRLVVVLMLSANFILFLSRRLLI